MTGGDKIVSRIGEEAREQAQAILVEAEEQAAALLARAEAEDARRREETLVDAEKQAAALVQTARSGAALTVRNALLRRRRALIDAAMEQALSHLRRLPDADYFAQLARLAQGSALAGDGVVRLGAADLRRMPADFERTIQPENGTLRVSPEPAAFDGGLRLEYGEIEIDLTFDALRTAKREALEDLLNRELFGQVG